MFLTGIKPTGDLHLGNYLGAIRPALRMNIPGCFCLADYHALTTITDSDFLKSKVKNMSALLIALGAGDNYILYRQSDIPEVHELSWYISCCLNDGIIKRNHAAKSNNGPLGIGTFMYPILMAADILLYQIDMVPVGKDQLQHLEIAQLAAKSLNQRAGKEIVKIPKAFVQNDCEIIPGLDGKKMSKSYNNTIPLITEDKNLKKLISSIKTDSTPMSEPMDYQNCNVYKLYCQFASLEEILEMQNKYNSSSYGYGHAKKDLYEVISREISPIKDRYFKILNDDDGINEYLEKGKNILKPIAEKTLFEYKTAIGLKC